MPLTNVQIMQNISVAPDALRILMRAVIEEIQANCSAYNRYVLIDQDDEDVAREFCESICAKVASLKAYVDLMHSELLP